MKHLPFIVRFAGSLMAATLGALTGMPAQTAGITPCGCRGAVQEVTNHQPPAFSYFLFEAEGEPEYEPTGIQDSLWKTTDTLNARLNYWQGAALHALGHNQLEQPDDRGRYGRICYALQLGQPGFYRFSMRAVNMLGNTTDNSIWMRFPQARAYRQLRLEETAVAEEFGDPQDGWFVAYRPSSRANTLGWDTRTGTGTWGGLQVADSLYNIYVEFETAGTYRLEISAREHAFAIDRFLLMRVDTTHTASGQFRITDNRFPDGTDDFPALNTAPPELADTLAVSIETSNDNLQLCPGEELTLMGMHSGGIGEVALEWQDENGMAAGQGPVLQLTPTQAGTFGLLATDDFGCTAMSSASVSLNELPHAEAGDDLALCAGVETDIQLQGGASGGSPGYQFSWEPAALFSNPQTASPQLPAPEESTTFVLTVTDSEGCTHTDSLRFVRLPLPTIDSSGLTHSLLAAHGQPFSLSLSGSPAGTGFRWEVVDFENLLQPPSPDSGQVFNASFQLQDTTQSGAVSYRLVPVLQGCEGEPLLLNILVFYTLEPIIPPILSPNGDGVNDLWQLRSPKDASFHLQVFSRRGALVFESRTPGQAWDGGQAPDGIYWYRLELKGEVYKGAVLLQRTPR